MNTSTSSAGPTPPASASLSLSALTRSSTTTAVPRHALPLTSTAAATSAPASSPLPSSTSALAASLPMLLGLESHAGAAPGCGSLAAVLAAFPHGLPAAAVAAMVLGYGVGAQSEPAQARMPRCANAWARTLPGAWRRVCFCLRLCRCARVFFIMGVGQACVYAFAHAGMRACVCVRACVLSYARSHTLVLSAVGCVCVYACVWVCVCARTRIVMLRATPLCCLQLGALGHVCNCARFMLCVPVRVHGRGLKFCPGVLAAFQGL